MATVLQFERPDRQVQREAIASFVRIHFPFNIQSANQNLSDGLKAAQAAILKPDDDNLSVDDAVASILREYKNEIEPVLDLTFRVTHTTQYFVEEIRNFTSHVANAVIAHDADLAALELARARRHLYLAMRDGLEATLLVQTEYVTSFVERVVRHDPESKYLKKDLSELKAKLRSTLQTPSEEGALDDSEIVASVNRTVAIVDRLMESITEVNQLAQTLETEFAQHAPRRRSPNDITGNPFTRTKRNLAIKSVWSYAGALAALLCGIELATIRSPTLLLPILLVCVFGGLIGTFIAITEDQAA